MQIVPEVIKKVELAGAKLVAVTKYFSAEETTEVLNQLKENTVFLALGENRITQIKDKNIPRELLHFIGNIQSRDIPDIAQNSSVVHSLCSIKHAEIFAKQEQVPSFYLQVNISREPQKSGIMPEDLGKFLQEIDHLKLDIKGISAIGAGDFNLASKRKEFQELISLRDKFLPGKSISAGTSRDYEIALEEGIDLVRVGQALFKGGIE